ncbi:MAG: glycosyltransferase family 39 protein [Phycisphaerae bacterium]|nr:glycosyltransferase family 39 protein [Phycisphaerae bacterium]
MGARSASMASRPTVLIGGQRLHLERTPVAAQPGRAGVVWKSAGLALVALLACFPSMGDWCSFSPDVFRYLTIARTLWETGHFPPHEMMTPPAFPAIIAPLLVFGETPFLALRILFSACWAVTGVMTYLLHRRALGERLGWVAGLLVASSPVLLVLTTTPLSEPVFTAIATIVLVVMDSWWRRPVSRWTDVALGGLLTAAAFMVRSMGIVLLPVMAITLLRHRSQTLGRRATWLAIFMACSTGPFVAWQIRQSAYPHEYSYLDTWVSARSLEHTNATGLALQLERLAMFGPMRLEALKEAVLPREVWWQVFNPPLDRPTTWLVGGFFVVVAIVRFIRYRSPVDAYLLLTLLVLCLWPWDEGVRFVAPLIPVLVGYPLWVGLSWWRHPGRRPRWVRVALASVLLMVLAVQVRGMAVVQSRLPARRAKAARRFAAMSDLGRWHVSNTPTGARWVGVTPDLHNSKILLLGASYLSRRPVRTIDVQDGQVLEIGANGESCVFIHESLLDGMDGHEAYTAIDRVGEFVVFVPAVIQPEQENGLF